MIRSLSKTWSTLLIMLICSACVQSTLDVSADSVTEERGISYGRLADQKFDVYRPPNDDGIGPVIVFLYGGSWSNGSRGLYRFVGRTLAKSGFVTAIPDYRTYPEVVFPTFVKDSAKAVAAIKERLSPNRPIFLIGHSAGAHIAALLTVDKSYLRAEGLAVCADVGGLVGLAGPYNFTPSGRGKYSKIFPEATRAQSMPFAFAGTPAPPSLLLHGSSDRTVLVSYSRNLHKKLRAAGNRSQLKIYDGVGHVGMVSGFASFGRSRYPTLKDVTDFVKANAVAQTNTCS